MNKQYMILTALLLLTLILQVVAIATPDWSMATSGGQKLNMGLWKSCSSSTCEHVPPTPVDSTFPKNSLEAVRAFAVLGALLTAGALGSLFLFKAKKKLFMSLVIGSGVCSLIAMSIWTAEFMKHNGVKMSPGYSFYLNLSGGVLAVGTAFYCGYNMKGGSDTVVTAV